MTELTLNPLLNSVSLGVRSDYVVNHHEIELHKIDGAVAIRTPTSQDYYFGNYVAFISPITSYSKQEWERVFDQAFVDLPDVKHRTFVWPKVQNDNVSAVVNAFRSAGYQYQEEDILLLTKKDLQPLTRSIDSKIVIRPFEKPSDWQQWLEIGVALCEPEISKQGFLEYRQKRMESYRVLHNRALGNFYGAFVDSDLVGYAGVFHWQGIARYQDVRVVPGWQNKGIARQLIHHMATEVNPLVEQQIIIADAYYHATRLYQSLGFKPVAKEASLCLYPKITA